MVWKLTDVGKRVEPIPGIPWRNMDDEEFAEAVKEMDSRFPDQKGSLKRSSFFEHVPETPKGATEKE